MISRKARVTRRSKAEEVEQEEPEDKRSVSRKRPGASLAPEVLKERQVSLTSLVCPI